MKLSHFYSVQDAGDPNQLAKEALRIKADPFAESTLAKNKVMGLIFFNSSLRTRMSTTRAAYNLGLQVMTLNVSADSWQLETQDGVVMDQGKAEHIREAIPVMGSYCDLLGVRSFPILTDRKADYEDVLMKTFMNLAGCPVVNLESGTRHPLQSLADLMTIREHQKTEKPKVVLTWAPHIKPLPQSVANSFSEWMQAAKLDFTITHPEGMDLAPEFVGNAKVMHDQQAAFEGADFIYVKNWSSYTDYGKVHHDPSWLVTQEKLEMTNQGKLMHCLPVRRNVVIADDALDGAQSIVIQQAENRLYAAQAVLSKILKG